MEANIGLGAVNGSTTTLTTIDGNTSIGSEAVFVARNLSK